MNQWAIREGKVEKRGNSYVRNAVNLHFFIKPLFDLLELVEFFFCYFTLFGVRAFISNIIPCYKPVEFFI